MDVRPDGAAARNGSATLHPAITMVGDPITTGLQQMFAAIADEPIPDEFLRLLDEIDAKAAGSTTPGVGHS